MSGSSTACKSASAFHNYIGHYYIGHDYIGFDYMGMCARPQERAAVHEATHRRVPAMTAIESWTGVGHLGRGEEGGVFGCWVHSKKIH